MANIDVEKLKEKLYPAAKALFIIGETLVDESKMHISAEDAIKKIRSYMCDVDIISSRYCVDKLIEDCEEKYGEWTRNYLGKWVGLEPIEIDYPDCCDGCSNNPKNGGSGICNCTIPYFADPIRFSTVDTDGYVYFTTRLDSLTEFKADTNRIAEAVENTKLYEKRV